MAPATSPPPQTIGTKYESLQSLAYGLVPQL
jgi:hypothetical protein